MESRDGHELRFQVNYLAGFLLTAVLEPLLVRSAPARIVNVSSIAGRLSTPLMGWYCASKHGLEAVTDALRMEVEGDGIRVILVEPGMFGTDGTSAGVPPSTLSDNVALSPAPIVSRSRDAVTVAASAERAVPLAAMSREASSRTSQPFRPACGNRKSEIENRKFTLTNP